MGGAGKVGCGGQVEPMGSDLGMQTSQVRAEHGPLGVVKAGAAVYKWWELNLKEYSVKRTCIQAKRFPERGQSERREKITQASNHSNLEQHRNPPKNCEYAKAEI